MMQESNNDFFSIDAILLFDCCPIDVRLKSDIISKNKRVGNEYETYYERTRIGGTSKLLQAKSEQKMK